MTVRSQGRTGRGWTWIFTYPLVSVLAVTLYLRAVYGLTMHSLEEPG